MVLRVLLSKKESLSDRSNLLKYWEEKDTLLSVLLVPKALGATLSPPAATVTPAKLSTARWGLTRARGAVLPLPAPLREAGRPAEVGGDLGGACAQTSAPRSLPPSDDSLSDPFLASASTLCGGRHCFVTTLLIVKTDSL